MNRRYEVLNPQKKIAKSRQKPSEAKNDVDVAEDSFVNNTSLSDEHYREILAYDEDQLQKQHILLASAEYLILNNSGTSGFPFVMAS